MRQRKIMSFHNQIGALGENIAREYLIARGYAIYSGNDRSSGTEIDIIAFKDDTVVFVEVKTRSAGEIDPMEVVDVRKRTRLCRAADRFLRSHEIRHNPRFDIITVSVGNGSSGPVVTHYESAFIPGLTTVR